MSGPFGETVVQHSRTRGAPDSYGNDTWTDTDVTHNGVTLYPREAVELIQGQDTNIVGIVAVFVPAVTVLATDEFTARGERWAVDGDAGQYLSSLTGSSVRKLSLTRVEG